MVVRSYFWALPEVGEIKVNTDGAAKGNPSKGGTGFIIRNHRGAVLMTVAMGLGLETSYMAECTALIQGLAMAASNGWVIAWLESDSSAAVTALSNDIIPWSLKNVWKEAKKKMTKIRITRTWREPNFSFDKLAKRCAMLSEGIIESNAGKPSYLHKIEALSKIAANRLHKEQSEWQMDPPFGFKHKVTDNLQRYLQLVLIVEKYPYWNRSLGADHFMLSYHDWGPSTSSHVPQLFHNSIRVLCNANTSEGFNPSKDASFPEIHLRTGEITGIISGPSPSSQSILAFFVDRFYDHIILLLLEQWKNKDEDVQVYDSLSEGVSYNEMLKKSKYCLCPIRYEVASPGVVKAICAECVPVLISDRYVPPFSDILN
ncbi:hypothetical protein GIB67_018812 [Kingdonia uniflora]|uniref:RNase H type-1 domain-containing protein n=1 Tax=Kingdonia uniflora TaxID=39325 RepID=A0A7J7NES4_9MAGN|nr:hypothetical protein GIB67_018812 [Kingdonia uniflora]